MQRFLRLLAVVALLLGIGALPAAAAPTPKTVTVTITCGSTTTVTVNTAVAKDDDLAIAFGDGTCNTFSVDKFNNFTGPSGSIVVSGSTTVTLTSRKQYSALSTPKTTLATVSNGTITVTIANAAETTTSSFTSNSPPSGTVSTGYSYTFVATGSPNYYELASGTLPAGLTLSTAGVLSGTPSTAASYTFAVKVTNLVSDAVVTASSNTVTIGAGGATSQSITYVGASNTALSAGSVSVTATASSGLPVTMSSNDISVCTVSGSAPNFTLTLVSAGTCTTTASQVGDSTYAAATDETRTFTVTSDSGGGGGGSSSSSASPSATTAERKVTLCHRTSSRTNPYVQITVDENSVLREGHGSHTGPLFPENNWGDIIPPFDGYAGLNWPAGQSILDSGCDGMKSGKVTLCHATASKTNPYVLITVDQNAVLKKGHGSHTGPLYPQAKWGDIIPPFPGYAGLNWPGGQTILDSGCDPNGTPETAASRTAEPQPSGLATPSPAPTSGPKALKEKDVKFEPGPTSGEVKIVDKDGKPLTLLDAETNDGTEIDVVSSGADLNKPTVWEDLGYGEVCWKLEPFNEQYLYTLPNPIQPPSTAGAGPWFYKNVIVKAGSVTSSDSTLQPNTVFSSPAPGDVVWADVNANGIFDPGGQGKDKAISHIIICASTKDGGATTASEPPATQEESPSASASPSTSSSESSSPSASSSSSSEGKITLCHRTSSKTNPYVVITVDKSSVLQEGHGSHTGGIFPDPDWGDIIPAFDDYAGLNWPAGERVLEAGCTVGTSSATPTIAPPGKDKPPAPIVIRIKEPEPEPTALPSPPAGKVTLCHRTSSRTNPYVVITVDKSSVLQEGHGSHTGPLYPTRGWGDIIPPFDDYAGLNWPDGESIFNAGCVIPEEESPSPESSSASPSGSSASPSPSGSATGASTSASPTPSSSSTSASPSGSSASPSGSSSESPSGTATTEGSPSPSGSSTPGSSSSPGSSSGPGGTPSPSDTTPGDNAENREGTVKLTIAKGDSIITMEVPVARLTKVSSASGNAPAGAQTTTSSSGLADTGSDDAPVRAAIAALAVLALILVPTQVRRRRS